MKMKKFIKKLNPMILWGGIGVLLFAIIKELAVIEATLLIITAQYEITSIGLEKTQWGHLTNLIAYWFNHFHILLGIGATLILVYMVICYFIQRKK